jgi:hypothetical protein
MPEIEDRLDQILDLTNQRSYGSFNESTALGIGMNSGQSVRLPFACPSGRAVRALCAFCENALGLIS